MSSQIIFDCIYACVHILLSHGIIIPPLSVVEWNQLFWELSLFFLYQTMNLVLKHHSFFCDQFIFLINVYYRVLFFELQQPVEFILLPITMITMTHCHWIRTSGNCHLYFCIECKMRKLQMATCWPCMYFSLYIYCNEN